MNKSIIIIGGGAAGIFTAIAAKKSLPHAEIIILEKMPHIGTKLKITGGGRCNITHKVDDFNELIDYYPAGGKFLYSSFSRFGPKQTLDFFYSIGIETFTDRGGRIFPVFENAVKVVNILENHLRRLEVKIILNCEVKEILKQKNFFLIKTKNNQTYSSDKVILTTGGLSYPKTGSTGEGFDIAKRLGHTITPLRPSLVPLIVKEEWVKELQGLTLKNVEAKIVVDKKQIMSKFGDMLFTHFGLSGPIILFLSRTVVNLLRGCPKSCLKGQTLHSLLCNIRPNGDWTTFWTTPIKIAIDLKPALSQEKLDARLQRDFKKFPKKQFKNILTNFLPQKMIPAFIKLLGINAEIISSQINISQRKNIIQLLKNFEFNIKKDMDFYYAEVTQGGVSLNEVNPKTMESKICQGLFFAGEILDIDGYIGGFNLQAAFSTGYAAGCSGVMGQ